MKEACGVPFFRRAKEGTPDASLTGNIAVCELSLRANLDRAVILMIYRQDKLGLDLFVGQA